MHFLVALKQTRYSQITEKAGTYVVLVMVYKFTGVHCSGWASPYFFFIKGPCFSCLLYPTMECGPGRENCNTLGKILCRFSHWFKTLFSNTYDYICISPGKYLRLNILAYVYYINIPTLYNLTSHIMEFSLLYIRNYKKVGSLSLCTLYIVHCGIHD